MSMSGWSFSVDIEVPVDPVLSDAMHRADQLCYARQREWSGWLLIDRYKLRCLIADEIAEAVRAALAKAGHKS